jgi:organic radical activating enzyme
MSGLFGHPVLLVRTTRPAERLSGQPRVARSSSMSLVQESVPVIATDVMDFFKARRGAFGAMNLLPSHLPTESRIRRLVENVMTVDYAIATAYGIPLYEEYLQSFADETARSCGTVGLEGADRNAYGERLARLRAMDTGRLADEVVRASRNTMETVNLFIPKQCNMSCRGCYAAAVPITSRAYTDELVSSYYQGGLEVIRQARQLGAQNVYTSGDGEPTVFPRFFDFLEEIRNQGMQWLLFTAGLAFSSESAAVAAWDVARLHLQGPSRERIERRLHEFAGDEQPAPTARALLAELAEYRESVQIYHSLWSPDAARNSALRRPLSGDYRYVSVDSRGARLELPSGLVTMAEQIFTGDLRERLGVEMPVSDVSVPDLPAVAAYVVDQRLRSYFEPTILTGRNKAGDLGEAPPAALSASAPLLVRTLCGFRNVHQPTVKYVEHRTAHGFAASPGMGVDTSDLRSMGVLSPLMIGEGEDGLFSAVHAPLMAYANYVHITGCKCNDFAAELAQNREAIAARWRDINATMPPGGFRRPELLARLRGGDIA